MTSSSSRLYAIFSCLLLTSLLTAQDAYHNNLQNYLQSTYSLPAGNWMFNNTENANLNSDYTWGSLTSLDQNASGQDFSRLVRMNVTQVSGPQWNSGYGIQNVQNISAGNVCLLAIWLRVETGTGKVSLSLQDSQAYTGEFSLDYTLDTEWRQFLIPFAASASYIPGRLQLVLHLNWQSQTVQVGGVALLNYGNNVALDDLPNQINNEFYPGYESDAAWRSSAAERIDQLRKANLKVQVVDEVGMPLEGAEVQIKMLKHEFGFGTAVAAPLFAGNAAQNDTYEAHLLDLDGQGHGFNCVVFENATKWRAWEENWNSVTPTDKANTVQWLLDHGIKVRGHTLVWPSWQNMPADMEANQNDPVYLRNRALTHVETIVNYPGLAGNISDWDVLNEIATLHDLEWAMQGAPNYPTGREVYVDIFNKLLEIDPDAVTFLNDYITFGGGSSLALTNELKQYTQEIIDAGVPLDGIGFQAHIGAFPTGIEEVYNILEDFHATFDTKAKITEFDMNPLMNDVLAADYLSDFYTIAFSHESVDAILMWGFWDGAHWFDNAPLFSEDWSLKPAGQAFLDLVYGQWWTEESGTTNANGDFDSRGFKGTYEVSTRCNGSTVVDTIQLSQNVTFVKTCPFTTATSSIEIPLDVRIFPNPAKETLLVQWGQDQEGTIRIIDLLGRQVLPARQGIGQATFSLALPAGVYTVLLEIEGQHLARKVFIR